MSGLRQVLKDTIPEGDIEAPKDKGESKTSLLSDSTPSKPSHNPVFLAKVVLRKVIGLVMSSDEEDLSQPGGVVTLLKDIILGVILGVLTISMLIFLDHRDVVHFQSAHNFRNAAFQLLNDPETIANIEESSDLKFMTINEFESKRKEIDSVAEKLKGHEEVLAKRVSEAEEKKKEMDGIKEEYAALMANPLLGLDKFCGGCIWSGKTSCDVRVTFLQDTYNTRPIAAKINAMLHPSCKKE
eukprot:CAMPEP_0172307472 /NCGR_PEP_ID=MMETSP1058-20130122/8320_1 /TAXON_ID=83371 /ORGANISM="Detonula confervacea, Strain CCMP 353" /LENGTH=240 /DNA_ID=CAMNT_0013019645 /DNA_START=84 /DNA_END=806 /DNA_ORIENTATION=+